MKRCTAVLLSLLLIAAACSDDDESVSEGDDRTESTGEVDAESEGEEAEGSSDTTEADDEAVADAERVASAWLEETYGLDEDVLDTLAPTRTVRGRNVTHVHFGQRFDDLPVRGAEVIVHVLDGGEVQGASDALTEARPPEGVEQQVDEAEATDIANKAIADVTDTASADVVWLEDGERLRLGWSVLMSTESGAYRVWVDAVTGEVADARQVAPHSMGGSVPTGAQPAPCDLEEGAEPAACIFAPDPVFASEGELSDLDEANDFLTPEPLLGLDEPESGALVGEFVNTESRFDAERPVREADGTWEQGRGEPGFEAAMSYVWIDRTQRLMQELGFTDLRAEPFDVVPLDPAEEDNAFYDPASQAIFLGVGAESGINFGEDASVIVHEYGHAILDEQQPGLLTEEGGAYHEAFGDILALLVTLDGRSADGDPGCLTSYVLGGTCIRRLDEDKVFPDDIVNEVHLDGEIYTGAVFDILEGLLAAEELTIGDCEGTDVCDAVRDRLLATTLASNQFLTPNVGLEDVAAAFVLANEAGFEGADGELIQGAFDDHGLGGGGGVIVNGDGQPTGEVPAASVAIDITHSFRGDLAVQVQVVDADFEDLCEPISVLEPLASDDGDNLVGRIDVSASDCAELLPPGPDQRWVLSVEDTVEEDEGMINAFKVFEGQTRFLATGVPAPIPDADPTGTQVIVDDSGVQVPEEGEEDVEEGVEVDEAGIALEISHTFVGDLFIRAGVADAEGGVLCSVPVRRPEANDDSDDLSGTIDMAECAELLPPGPDQLWFVEVIDTAAEDEGTIDTFAVVGPGGEVLAQSPEVPATIPDAADDGVTLAVGG